MSLARLAVRNLARRPVRTVLTVLSTAIAGVAFATVTALVEAADRATETVPDQVIVFNRASPNELLPATYLGQIRALPGVAAATGRTPTEGVFLRFPDVVPSLWLVDAGAFLQVFDELRVDPEQQAAWRSDPHGVLVADVLAKKVGLTVGQRLVLRTWRVTREVNVRGFVTDSSPTPNNMAAYLNVNLHDRYLFITVKPNPGVSLDDLAATIMRRYASMPPPLIALTQAQYEATRVTRMFYLLLAFRIASWISLVILALGLVNTISMNVREQLPEYGTLRAIGFRQRQILWLVLGESLAVSLVGAALGLAGSAPLLSVLGAWMQSERMWVFPSVSLDVTTAIVTLMVAAFLGPLACLFPALRAAREPVIKAIRRVD